MDYLNNILNNIKRELGFDTCIINIESDTCTKIRNINYKYLTRDNIINNIYNFIPINKEIPLLVIVYEDSDMNLINDLCDDLIKRGYNCRLLNFINNSNSFLKSKIPDVNIEYCQSITQINFNFIQENLLDRYYLSINKVTYFSLKYHFIGSLISKINILYI